MVMNDLKIIIGAYGSGKSEYAINLAKSLNSDKNEICLVDLDVVNPYFRSRDVQDLFKKEGIEVIAPESGYGMADLPMISPRVQGAIDDPNKLVILDVGGDPVGCKVLRRFEDAIKKRRYQMSFVVNTMRPFTSSVAEIIEMKRSLEGMSRLQVTEVVCNANLLKLTDLSLIEEAIEMLLEVSEKENVGFSKYLVMSPDGDAKYPEEIEGVKRVLLDYYLKKPWE